MLSEHMQCGAGCERSLSIIVYVEPSGASSTKWVWISYPNVPLSWAIYRAECEGVAHRCDMQ